MVVLVHHEVVLHLSLLIVKLRPDNCAAIVLLAVRALQAARVNL
jgi:hypothetical protein